MVRFITSLNDYRRERATPEENEAYRVTHEALFRRMNQMLTQNDTSRRMASPVTDRFGRPLSQSATR